MNRKGQALVEFVLIMPIFLFLVFAVYDFGMIFTKRNALENTSLDIIELYKNGKTLDEIITMYPGIVITINDSEEYHEIKVSNSIKIITPGLNRVFGNPYKITITRYIPNE